jgi:hypothetical protein
MRFGSIFAVGLPSKHPKNESNWSSGCAYIHIFPRLVVINFTEKSAIMNYAPPDLRKKPPSPHFWEKPLYNLVEGSLPYTWQKIQVDLSTGSVSSSVFRDLTSFQISTMTHHASVPVLPSLYY